MRTDNVITKRVCVNNNVVVLKYVDFFVASIYNTITMTKKISHKIKSLIRGDESNSRIKWSLYGRVWREIGAPFWKWLVAGIIFTILAAGAEA